MSIKMRQRATAVLAMLVFILSIIMIPIPAMASNLSAQEATNLVSAYDRTEAVSEKEALEAQHVSRLRNQEADLNTLVFQNADQTVTMYYFADAVKYIDSNGMINDKSNELTALSQSSEYAYASLDNNINSYFPKTLTGSDGGVVLSTDKYRIEMSPIDGFGLQVNANSAKVEYSKAEQTGGNSVYYSKVFGENTALVYTPLFNGFKEDIYLYENVGNSFSFIIDVGTLTPILSGGTVHLMDGDVVAGQFGELLVYDSASVRHQTFDNSYKITPIDDGRYEITITVDQAFLNDSQTVYPVIIDPTITISTSGSGTTKTIIDCPVYDGIPSANQGSNIYNHIGYVGTSGGVDYGVGRTLIKLPGLINNATFINLKACQVESAILKMWEGSGRSSSSTIYANYYTGSTWTETGTYKNNMSWNGYGTLINSQTFGTSVGKWVEFDLTSAISTWKANTTTANRGIILRNSNESNTSYSKAFFSTENSANKPYLSITYRAAPLSNAYSSNGGLAGRSVTLRLVGATTQNSTWTSIINSSRNAWNNSGAGVSIATTTSGTSQHIITVDAYPAQTWYGQCVKNPPGNVVATSSQIEINTSTISTSTNFRRSTVTHEMGHLFWLGDNPTTTETTLMSHNRNREAVFIPQAFDVYNVLYKYTTT